MVLLSTLGGLSLFGINGFVVGPLIAVLFIAFWQIFGREFRHDARDADAGRSNAAVAAEDPERSAPEQGG